MSDNDNEFMVTPMNSTKLTKIPLHHNPMIGLQSFLKIKPEKPTQKINNLLIYENIKNKLLNLSYTKIHLGFQDSVDDLKTKSQMTKLFNIATKFEEVDVEKAVIAEKLEKKMKNNFK